MIWEYAYEECLKNADKYLEDSIARKESSAGHALALAILGQEEVGKTFLTFLIGIAEKLGEAQFVDKWRKYITKHQTKLRLALMSSFAQSLATVETKKAMEEVPNLIAKAKSSGDPIGVTSQYLSKIYPSISQQAFSEEMKAFDISYELQDLKEKCLYVDVSPKDSRISTPLEISKADAEKQISKLKEGLEIVKNIISFVTRAPEKNRRIVAQICFNEYKKFLASLNIENVDAPK